jgi:outer membrane receptor protein involved in Fe transport
MNMRSVAAAVVVSLVCAQAVVAQTGGAATPDAAGAPQGPRDAAAAEVDVDPESPVYSEQVIVTASRTEESLVNAAASVSLITPETIQNNASTSYADLFRGVPGVNVTQVSARDINLTSRGASSSLTTSQLALVDGRSIYLDFFGFIAWDFLPVNPSEIKQIEVIRGPASAVWGANAMNGVVNVITKTPRELQGNTFTVGFGGFDRESAQRREGSGSLFYISGSHARALNADWAYKVSAGVYTQDPLLRPAGAIPNGTGTLYPEFQNQGTTQPKFDLRVDRDFEPGRRLVLQGGIAGTEGILHSGIGPFDIDRGTILGYAKVNYTRGPHRVNFFTNILDGSATNLLAFGPTGLPLQFDFKSQTYDIEAGSVQTLGQRNVLTYGANFRQNMFDLTIAPQGDNRTEGGVYGQNEFFINQHFRLLLGARLDKFDNIENVQFSPRTALLIKPAEAHTFRVSYNRAYRAPSVINNYLDTVILNQLPLTPFAAFNPALAGRVFTFPIRAGGNRIDTPGVTPADLVEQSISAYEVSYTGVLKNRATVTAAWFLNDTKDDVFFTQVASYRATNPPPGWPLPAFALELLYCPPTPAPGQNCPFGAGYGLPAAFSYRNLGKVRQTGLELGIDGAISKELTAFVNYSYQPTPEAIGFPASEMNLPPKNRFNLGANYNAERWLANLALSYQGEAFWQDVLDARYSGVTESYTQVNTTVGLRFGGRDRYTLALKIVNLLNQEIQQHIFGDIFKRQVTGELRVVF